MVANIMAASVSSLMRETGGRRKTEFCNFDEAVKQEPEGKCASIYLQCKLSHYSAFIDVTNKISVISERCSRQR
ncbi:hypothetical protein [Escherichia coli]|uniref:hypothetical protein n=1 Tax=Escherichia coli TaxID=562 RepID=UPI00092DA9B8|nr:hypothetical protein [Escherichia coli]APJ75938.1 hypothetical protein RG28_06370 [Escherichia coli]